MRAILAACAAMLVGVASCGSPLPAGTSPIQSARPFELRLGATGVLPSDDFSVTFTSLVGDSRCPTGVQCIWAGDGVIEVRLSTGSSNPELVRLHTMPELGDNASHHGYRVQLTALAPYPREGAQTPASDYRATLIVVPLQSVR